MGVVKDATPLLTMVTASYQWQPAGAVSTSLVGSSAWLWDSVARSGPEILFLC